ncbi:MAG: hypothetical protein LBE70_02405 [Nitrososphaerota archaeon]|jgi:hypothetical protein|nr:hypothetical protein [Nitrososphaerota archaeon]
MSTNKKIILPGHIEASIALRYKGASADKIEEIRALWEKQLILNEQLASQTNDTKDDVKQTRATAYMSAVIRTENFGGGNVYSPTNLEGTADGNTAWFRTPNLDQAAQVVGRLSDMNSKGTVKIVAKLGPVSSTATPKNKVTVWASLTGQDWDWLPIGHVTVTAANSGSLATYTVGSTSLGNQFVVVEVNTMTSTNAPGAVEFNDVLVDCVTFEW